MALQIVDRDNKKVAEIELDKTVFEKVHKAPLYYMMKAARNALRHGTSAVKDRSDINKTTSKMYRQKGTGRARHGARKVGIFVGGASTHGPRSRSYWEKVNKKLKHLGYREVLKHLLQNERLKVINEFKFEKPSTREAAALLKNLGLKSALVILPAAQNEAFLSFRNLRGVTVASEANLNIHDFLACRAVLVRRAFFESLKERYGL